MTARKALSLRILSAKLSPGQLRGAFGDPPAHCPTATSRLVAAALSSPVRHEIRCLTPGAPCAETA